MHPDAESHYHRSPLGVARCSDCGGSWPCHLSAWGRPDRTSTCNRCGGVVRWALKP